MRKTWSYDDGVVIDCDFPGGNIVVERRAGDCMHLRQDVRDTEGDWFYWCFRVRGAEGRRMEFRFVTGDVIGARGPACSVDGGERWVWLGEAAAAGVSFFFEFAEAHQQVRFCMAIPYLDRDLRRFLGRHDGEQAMRVDTLCRTEGGRDAEIIHAGCLDGDPRHRILVTARHHCCESLGSYALEGILESVLGSDELGEWYRTNVDVMAVPFVDKDGVEQGDQGKYRRPHDHDLDYGEQPIYRTVAALKRQVLQWSDGGLHAALDLHCPYIKGGEMDEVIYFVGGEDQRNWRRVCEFAEVFEEIQRGPLRYAALNNLPFGRGWNTKANYGSGRSCASWTSGLPGITFGTSLEIPYANAGGQEVNAATARLLGRDLARAIRTYLGPARAEWGHGRE